MFFQALCLPVNGLSSQQCLSALQQAIQRYGEGNNCHRTMCGSLDTSSNLEEFSHRMSPQCQAKMFEYRRPEPLTSPISTPDGDAPWRTSMLRSQLAKDLSSEDSRQPAWDRCSTGFAGRFASNPVVVENHVSANFVMCTIPKAGCTLLRSLLYVLTHPEEETRSFGHPRVHEVAYPTAWHYRNGGKHESETYPTVRHHISTSAFPADDCA